MIANVQESVFISMPVLYIWILCIFYRNRMSFTVLPLLLSPFSSAQSFCWHHYLLFSEAWLWLFRFYNSNYIMSINLRFKHKLNSQRRSNVFVKTLTSVDKIKNKSCSRICRGRSCTSWLKIDIENLIWIWKVGSTAQTILNTQTA